MKLYTFWRSQAAFRVRIALNPQSLTREDTVIDLDRGDQFKPECKAQNPQAVVPTLYDDNAKLFQSVAILEYLEEKYPSPPRSPLSPRRIRASSQISRGTDPGRASGMASLDIRPIAPSARRPSTIAAKAPRRLCNISVFEKSVLRRAPPRGVMLSSRWAIIARHSGY